MTLPGTDLTSADLAKLAKCGITPEIARAAQLRRVRSNEGGPLVGRNGAADYAGIVFPYIWPGEQSPREYRLRRDRPEYEQQADGSLKERNKYLSPPGKGNLLYLPPQVRPEWLNDGGLPLVVTEGEKKTLALWALAWHGLGDAAEVPRFLPVGLPGVWSWRGTTGKTTGPDGDRRDVKGPIPDWLRIALKDRKVTILYDVNGRTNGSVQAARAMLTRELAGRGARVYHFVWPNDTPAEVNGIDDMIAAVGAATAMELIEAAVPAWHGTRGKESKPFPGSLSAGSLATRRLVDIQSRPVCWLWPGRIARGKLTIIAGNPGLGKSQVTASIAAVVTTGGRWPVDRQQCRIGDVLFLSAEDDAADTLRPRLEAAGADLRRVHVVEGVIAGYTQDGSRKDRTFSLEKDLQALESKLSELRDVALVVIDPISAYLGDVDSHKNADVRGLLAPLSELAARHNTAIIGVSHLNKAGGAQALMRVTGSLAFVAAARAAYLVAADLQDKMRRLFLPMKNNLGPDAAGLAFRIEPATLSSPAGPLETSRVAWESEPVPITADEAMQAEAQPGSANALEVAKDWLRETLANGPVAVAEVIDAAKADGIAEKTLRRASKALGIEKEKEGMTGPWWWSLPQKMAKSAEDAQGADVAIFGENGHLREDKSESFQK